MAKLDRTIAMAELRHEKQSREYHGLGQRSEKFPVPMVAHASTLTEPDAHRQAGPWGVLVIVAK